jgi:hypothetical protein
MAVSSWRPPPKASTKRRSRLSRRRSTSLPHHLLEHRCLHHVVEEIALVVVLLKVAPAPAPTAERKTTTAKREAATPERPAKTMAVRPVPTVAPLAQALTVQAVLTLFVIHLELFLQIADTTKRNAQKQQQTKTKRLSRLGKKRRFTQTGSG